MCVVQKVEDSEEEADDDDDDDDDAAAADSEEDDDSYNTRPAYAGRHESALRRDGPDSHPPARDLIPRTGLVPRTSSTQPSPNPRQSTGNAYSDAHPDLSTRFARMDVRIGNNSIYAPQFVSIVAPSNPDIGNQSRNKPNVSQRDSNKGGRGKSGRGRKQLEEHDEL
ncbi:hypothetical protein LTR95_012023 [Oleoguttula sp. CCFEE 5521]